VWVYVRGVQSAFEIPPPIHVSAETLPLGGVDTLFGQTEDPWITPFSNRIPLPSCECTETPEEVCEERSTSEPKVPDFASAHVDADGYVSLMCCWGYRCIVQRLIMWVSVCSEVLRWRQSHRVRAGLQTHPEQLRMHTKTGSVSGWSCMSCNGGRIGPSSADVGVNRSFAVDMEYSQPYEVSR